MAWFIEILDGKAMTSLYDKFNTMVADDQLILEY